MFTVNSIGIIAELNLDNPSPHNAIAIDQWSNFVAALDSIAECGARALIVRSTNHTFCAGANINDLGQLVTDSALRRHFREEMARAFDTLAALPLATIASIDGGCYGAGVALALACDIRIAGDKAAFGITPAKLGIAYPSGDVTRLKRLIGPGQAARLLFSAKTIHADEAYVIGLVEQRAERADEAARALAETIAANSPASIMALKRILANVPESDQLFEDAFGGADFREGVAAFRARRKPEF